MNRDGALRQFIGACEAHEHAEPATVALDAPFRVGEGGPLYRMTYDIQVDEVVAMLDDTWRKRLALARERAREHVVDLGSAGESVRIRQGGREWVVSFDGMIDQFVCARTASR